MIFYPGLQAVYGGLLVLLLTYIPARRSALIGTPHELAPLKGLARASDDSRMARTSQESFMDQFNREFNSRLKDGNGQHTAVITQAPTAVENADGSRSYISGQARVSRVMQSRTNTHASGATSSFRSDSRHIQKVTVKETPHKHLEALAHLLPPDVKAQIAANTFSPGLQFLDHEHPAQLTHLGSGGHHSPPVSQILPPPQSHQTSTPSQHEGVLIEEIFDEPETPPAPKRPDSTASPGQARIDEPMIEEVHDESPPEKVNQGHHQHALKVEVPKPPTQSQETSHGIVEEPDEKPKYRPHYGPEESLVDQTDPNLKAGDPIVPPASRGRPVFRLHLENGGVDAPPSPNKLMPLKQFEIMAERRMGFTPQQFTRFQADLRKEFGSVPSEANKEANPSALIQYTLRWLNKNVADHKFKNQLQDGNHIEQVVNDLQGQFQHMTMAETLVYHHPEVTPRQEGYFVRFVTKKQQLTEGTNHPSKSWDPVEVDKLYQEWRESKKGFTFHLLNFWDKISEKIKALFKGKSQ